MKMDYSVPLLDPAPCLEGSLVILSEGPLPPELSGTAVKMKLSSNLPKLLACPIFPVRSDHIIKDVVVGTHQHHITRPHARGASEHNQFREDITCPMRNVLVIELGKVGPVVLPDTVVNLVAELGL